MPRKAPAVLDDTSEEEESAQPEPPPMNVEDREREEINLMLTMERLRVENYELQAQNRDLTGMLEQVMADVGRINAHTETQTEVRAWTSTTQTEEQAAPAASATDPPAQPPAATTTQHWAVARRDVCTQSQCTYTSLKGNLNPRFKPLPEISCGAWPA